MRTKKISWTILRKYCWKKALLTEGSPALAKLLTTSKHTSIHVVSIYSSFEGERSRESLTVKTGVCNVPHCVFDSPDDTVHEQFELIGRYTQQG